VQLLVKAGSRLQKRRLEGQSDLEFIQANNADMERRNLALKQKNEETAKLIAEAKKETELIKASVATSAAKQDRFKDVAEKLEDDQLSLKESKADALEELSDQEAMLVTVQNGEFPAEEADMLEKQIASLRSQLEVLEEGERELASISSTTF